MQSNLIAPIRKKYDFFVILMLAVAILGAIPMGFCESLKGFFLIYFIIYLSVVVIGFIVICILFSYIRKGEIKFFKNIYSIEHMEKFKTLLTDDGVILFSTKGVELEFSSKGLKNLDYEDTDVIEYQSFQISSTYQCAFAGEIYKVFINLKRGEEFYSIQLTPFLYFIIRSYGIKVENLESVLNDCENNLNQFFKTMKKDKK